MRQFQQLMSQFLQTQALVMTTYLQGAPVPAEAGAPVRAPRPKPSTVMHPAVLTGTEVAPRHVAPVTHGIVAATPMAAGTNGSAAAAPAATGTNGTAAAAPIAPVAIQVLAPAPAAERQDHSSKAPGISAPDVIAQLLQIVGDRTGYPEEMLDVDVDIEADLGIDSIKRMEVLTAFQQLHAGTQRGAFQGAMEKLTALKTLRQTAGALAEVLAGQNEAAVVA
jgi:hypothetical protein